MEPAGYHLRVGNIRGLYFLGIQKRENKDNNAQIALRQGWFTRLTNGFSKKIENHEAAVALHYMYYNFARIHQTLRVTPAMEAEISNHVWSIQEIVALANVEQVTLVA